VWCVKSTSTSTQVTFSIEHLYFYSSPGFYHFLCWPISSRHCFHVTF